MKNTESTKTLTASLPQDAQALFTWIADPENLPRWHSSFCRSLRRENGSLIVESPRGPVAARFIRDDHSLVLDILTEVAEGIELTNAVRVLRNGVGSEIIWTLIRPEGVSEGVFHDQIRWAGSALQALRKTSLTESVRRTPDPVAPAPGVPAIAKDPAETIQEPSSTETALPQSGKKLFVGNLSYAWTDADLRTHFSEQGSIVTAEIARFRGRGGRSRGFGFVEMSTEAEAQSAIEKLHGGTAGGRQIIVRLAKSQESRPASAEPALPITGEQASKSAGAQIRPSEPRQQKPSSRGRARRLPGSARGSPPRRPAEPPARTTGRRPSPAARQPYTEKDITNKSGYEIFPRGARGEKSQSSSSFSGEPRSNLEASPYMDDTGDIENHGGRPPRRPPGRRP